jgi:hypothetical protein
VPGPPAPPPRPPTTVLVGPLATEAAQARARAFAAACAAGDCRYRDPQRGRAAVDRDTAAGCAGYTATLALLDGGPVLRWGRCARFRAWWRVEQARIRARRADAARERADRGTP